MSYQKRKKKAVQEISEMQKNETKEGVKKEKEVLPLDINIKEFPWTEKQKIMIEVAQMPDTKVVMINAPPGVGKTLVSVFVSLALLKKKKVNKISYLRVPKESCSVGIGFLKGTADEKMEAFGVPCSQQLMQLIGVAATNKLVSSGVLEVLTIGHIKGLNLSGAIICDEAEDASIEEIRMILTRLCKNSIMFLIGDENQSNIRNSGFRRVFDAFNTEESMEKGIFCFELTAADSMRSGITKYIIEKFESIQNR